MNLYSEKFIERLQNYEALKELAAFQSQLAECMLLAGAVKGLACSETVFPYQAGETLGGAFAPPDRHTSTTSRQTLICTVTAVRISDITHSVFPRQAYCYQ